MRFQVLIILFFATLGNAFSQGNSIYQIAPMAVCWNTPANVDSNLVAYWLFSSRETTPKVVSYLTASGTAVVVAGGTIQNGFCCCSGSRDTLGIEINGDTLILTQNGNVYTYIGASGADDDWRWVDPAGDNMYQAIYREGKAALFTQDTTYGFRVDSTYRFSTDGNTAILEWMRGDTITDNPTWLFRAPGGGSGETNEGNSITIASTVIPQLRGMLGMLKFAAPYTGSAGGYYRTGAMIGALTGTADNDTTDVSLQFYTRTEGESFMRNTMTLEGDGRLELDRYFSFEDGIPERMLGFDNDPDDVTVHTVSGNKQDGNVLGINGFGLEWMDPDTLGVQINEPVEQVLYGTGLPGATSNSGFKYRPATGNRLTSVNGKMDFNTLGEEQISTVSAKSDDWLIDVDPDFEPTNDSTVLALMRFRHRGTSKPTTRRPLIISEDASGGPNTIQLFETGLKIYRTENSLQNNRWGRVQPPNSSVDIGFRSGTPFAKFYRTTNNADTTSFFEFKHTGILFGYAYRTSGPAQKTSFTGIITADDFGTYARTNLSTVKDSFFVVQSDTVILNGPWVNIGANKLRVFRHSNNQQVSIQGFIRGGTIATSLPGSPDAELPFGGFLTTNGWQAVAYDDGVMKPVAVLDINGGLQFQSMSGGAIDLTGGSDYLYFSITYYNP